MSILIPRYRCSLASAALLWLLPAAGSHAHVTLTHPEGGEDLAGGSELNIAWDADDHDCVYHLLFSPDSGATWSPVVQNLPQATRAYRWTLPEINTGKAVVRVLQDNVSGTDLDDRSPVFRIHSASAVRKRDAAPGDPALEFRLGHWELALALARSERVSARAYDAGGRLLATVLDQELPPGPHRLRLDFGGHPSGGTGGLSAAGTGSVRPYLLRVEVGGRVSVFEPAAMP